MSTEPRGEAAPESPCIEVCVLDEQGLCQGCFRTLEEIAAWGGMTPAQQRAVIAACQARSKAA